MSIEATLRSSSADTVHDKALVATWLTKLESPWEATLTYRYFLPEEHAEAFTRSLGKDADKERFSPRLG